MAALLKRSFMPIGQPLPDIGRVTPAPEPEALQQAVQPQLFGNAWQRGGILGKLGIAGALLGDFTQGMQGRPSGQTQNFVQGINDQDKMDLVRQQIARFHPDLLALFDVDPKGALAALAPVRTKYEQADLGGVRGVFDPATGQYKIGAPKLPTLEQIYEQSPIAQQRKIEVAKAGVPPMPAPPPGFVVNAR